MRVKDVLTKPGILEVHVLLSEANRRELGVREVWFGSCEYDGERLLSLDGDSYSLDEEIAGFLDMGDHMIYWIREDNNDRCIYKPE